MSVGSRIPGLVSGVWSEPVVFEAAPSMAQPAAVCGKIRVGDAAVSFDPVCGDGTGNAVRSAILAAAVINAVTDGLSWEEGIGYYNWRLQRAFLGHAKLCEGFYRSEFPASVWSDEMERASRASESLQTNETAGNNPARFHLDGLHLCRTKRPSVNSL
jgi:hypothetical protein